MHHRANLAAAALALAMAVATAGTIQQAASASAPDLVRGGEARRPAPTLTPWEHSLVQAFTRVEDGFLMMAGRTRLP